MNQVRLHILVIDDDPGDAEILRRRLAELTEFEVQFTHHPSIAAAQSDLTRPDVDVFFIDYNLGADCGRDILATMRSTGDQRPYIAITGQGDQRVAAALMRAGADDYLVKGEITPAALRRAIDIGRAQHVRRKMETMNWRLLEDLQVVKAALEAKNNRLAELCQTAHQFVDHVSHEFRTPLTVIKEFASIMHDGLAGAVNDEQREYLGIIAHRVDDLSFLVDDMLDMSKLEAGVMNVCRGDCTAAEILDHARPTLLRRAAACSADLIIDLPPDLPSIYCDAEKIGRVIINLVINALKFCGQPGRVALRAVHHPDEHEVRILVEDNGPGISQESLKRLFQRFAQLDGATRSGVKGFGLGLSIAKELVDLNFGQISVESEPGTGSTFWFSIPASDRNALIRRFLKHASTARGLGDAFSILRAQSDPAAGVEALEDVARLVRHHTRRTDLHLRARPHEWLMVAAAEQGDVHSMIARIRQALSDAAATSTAALPPVSIECLGTWSAREQSDALIETFLAAEQQREPSHA